MERTRWVRQTGAGCVYTGPCLIFEIILQPVGDAEHVTVYDGRDAVDGKALVRLVAATTTTQQVSFGQGVRCDEGIYLDTGQATSIVTVVFQSLPWTS